ncbi:MAG: hypothetical protein WA777_08590 [Rhodanobacter sp.]
MKTLLPLLCLLALAACSNKPPEPQAAANDTATTASVTTPWDGLKKDEQRAKDVQKAADKQAADQQKQIDDATQ